MDFFFPYQLFLIFGKRGCTSRCMVGPGGHSGYNSCPAHVGSRAGGLRPPHPPGGLGQVGWGITHMGSKWCCKPFSHTYMAGRAIVGSISSQSLCKISPFGNRVVEYVKFARLIVAKRSPSNQTFGEKRNVT